jgi:hypothetical protein
MQAPSWFRLAAASAALLACASAQDKPAATTAASGPVLRIAAVQDDVIGRLVDTFGCTDPLPEVGEGQHYLLSMDGGRKVSIHRGDGDVGFLRVTADPAGLMRAYAEQVKQGEAMLRGLLTMSLQQAGVAPRDAAAFVKGMLEFPQQIRELTVDVSADPRAAKQQGLDVVVRLAPAADTPFAKFVAALEPGAAGAPVLPGDANAFAVARMSLAPAALQAMKIWLVDWTAALVQRDPARRDAMRGMFERWIPLYDGDVAMSFSGPGTGAMIFGVTDAAAVQALIASDEYATMVAELQPPGGEFELDVKRNVFEHRGAQVLSMQYRSESGVPNPMLGDGAVDGFAGAFGKWFVGTFGRGETDAKALFDLAADGKIARAPLPSGAVLWMEFALARFAAMSPQAPGNKALDRIPERLSIAFGRADGALKLVLRAK